ncbi:MAG TPA: hypothetical protein DCY35_01915, partial [Prolixibacteraceae bacterium]|nr:hypothetical protein [Prolixibacteraceae bacterium]
GMMMVQESGHFGMQQKIIVDKSFHMNRAIFIKQKYESNLYITSRLQNPFLYAVSEEQSLPE